MTYGAQIGVLVPVSSRIRARLEVSDPRAQRELFRDGVAGPHVGLGADVPARRLWIEERANPGGIVEAVGGGREKKPMDDGGDLPLRRRLELEAGGHIAQIPQPT